MVAHELIVLAVIVGTGATVIMGWAIAHHFEQETGENESPAVEANLAFYMREVRLHHHDELAASFGGRPALVCWVVMKT